MNWKTILSSVRKLPVKKNTACDPASLYRGACRFRIFRIKKYRKPFKSIFRHGRFIRSRQERSGWHILMTIPMHCFAVCV